MKKTSLLICTLGAATLVACGGGNGGAEGAKTDKQTTDEMNKPTIALEKPAETGTTLLEALNARASTREYSTEGLSMEQLSGVMWAAAGENRPGRLTAPSAMALYPIKTYAVMAHGVYLYDAPSHTLVRVAEGDHRRLAGLQDFVYTAPLDIMYVADMAPYAEAIGTGRISESDALRLCAMDAAGYCQNANLWAAAAGLGSVTRAGARGDEFLKLIEAPENYRFVLAQTVGVKVEAARNE